MNATLKALLVSAGLVFAGQAAAQISLYADEGFRGKEWRADHQIDDFANSGFNDEASSAQVRGGPWQVCTDAHFQGRCVVLRPGDYPSLGQMGLNDNISSIRPLDSYGRNDEREYRGNSDRYSDRPYDERGDRSYDDRYYAPQWDQSGRYRQ